MAAIATLATPPTVRFNLPIQLRMGMLTWTVSTRAEPISSHPPPQPQYGATS